ncbi:MAG: (5-formylfuran-3-yl)methyl phosphate synthase [Candidatus Bathyarchaeia archaeon]
MKLLISPMNEKEASEAIAGGADIIDVKNPQEGALGANFPWVIKRIREIAPRKIQVSCTLGDVPNLPGSISLAALGAASLGVDYIKVGLYGFKTPREAVFLLQNVNKAAKECNPKIKVVATGYADAERISTLDPMLIPEIASKAQVDLAMIDTAVKDGKNLFNFLAVKQLEKFVDEAHKLGLEAALAGSLRKQDLPMVYGLGADVAGLRGAACTNSDRVSGQITRKLVQELVETVKQAENQANTKRA